RRRRRDSIRVQPRQTTARRGGRNTYAARAAPSAYRLTRVNIALSPTSRDPSPRLSMIVRTKSSGIASVVSGGCSLIALNRMLRHAGIGGACLALEAAQYGD